MDKFFKAGTVFRSDKSDFVAWGFVESRSENGIVFFILSSKLPKFKKLTEAEATKLHDAFKEAGAYKEAEKTMGVYVRYVTEENENFVKKMTGIDLA